MDVSTVSFSLTKILLLYILPICFDLCESQAATDVRIVDGSSPRDGRVEINVNDKWGTVCTDGWTDTEAAVVCAQLGFEGSAVSQIFGPAELAIDVPVYSVSCSKGDSSLADCDIEKTEPEVMLEASLDYLNGLEYYIHDQNAGVSCEDAIIVVRPGPATIAVNVIGLVIAIGVVVLCSCLTYRVISRSAAKKGKGKPESMAMYSSRTGRDNACIPENADNIREEPVSQYAAINPLGVEPENVYMQSTVNNAQQV